MLCTAVSHKGCTCRCVSAHVNVRLTRQLADAQHSVGVDCNVFVLAPVSVSVCMSESVLGFVSVLLLNALCCFGLPHQVGGVGAMTWTDGTTVNYQSPGALFSFNTCWAYAWCATAHTRLYHVLRFMHGLLLQVWHNSQHVMGKCMGRNSTNYAVLGVLRFMHGLPLQRQHSCDFSACAGLIHDARAVFMKMHGTCTVSQDRVHE